MPVLLCCCCNWLKFVFHYFLQEELIRFLQCSFLAFIMEWHFEWLKYSLVISSSRVFYQHCCTIFWYGNLLWGNLRSDLFFSLVNDLIFCHCSPKDSLSLKISSFIAVFLCVTFPGTLCILSILQSKSLLILKMSWWNIHNFQVVQSNISPDKFTS